MRYIGIEAVMESEGGSAIFSVVVQSDAFFLSFSEKSSSSDKKWQKVWLYQEYCLLLGQSWSRRKRTAAMKTRMNERIERYLAIEMWKFRSQQ